MKKRLPVIEEKRGVEPQDKIAERMKKIKHKLIVMSGKGGVGKSTIATNLAIALSENYKVGLLDLDLTGPDVAMMLGVEDKKIYMGENGILPVKVNDNLSVVSLSFFMPSRHAAVIWRGPMKIGAINQLLGDVDWGSLDFLVIDLPPGTSDEPLSVAQNIPDADGVIIVTTPQEVALLDIRKSISFAASLNLPVLGIVENMSGFKCPHCKKEIEIFKKGGGEKTANEVNVPFLGRIPFDPRIVELSDSGKPFIIEHKESDAAIAFRSIIKKLLEAIE